MFVRIMEIGIYCSMEVSVEKINIKRILRQRSSTEITIEETTG
jgi:hypothetical protein